MATRYVAGGSPISDGEAQENSYASSPEAATRSRSSDHFEEAPQRTVIRKLADSVQRMEQLAGEERHHGGATQGRPSETTTGRMTPTVNGGPTRRVEPSALAQLSAARINVAELIQLSLRLEDDPIHAVLSNLLAEFTELKDRCLVLEENQRVLEENQNALMSDNTSLRAQLEQSAQRTEAAEAEVGRLYALLDVKKDEVEAAVKENTPVRRMEVLHGTPAFTRIIKKFDDMAHAVNQLADRVDQIPIPGLVQDVRRTEAIRTVPVTVAQPVRRGVPIANTEVTPSKTTLLKPAETPAGATVIFREATTPATMVRATINAPGLATPHPSVPIAATVAPTPLIRAEGVPEARVLPVSVGLEISDGAEVEGVRIVNVKPGGPADKAGLHEDDFILSIAGVDVATRAEFRAVLQDLRPGDAVPVVFMTPGAFQAIRTSLLLGHPEEGVVPRRVLAGDAFQVHSRVVY
eukprot:TRINITY_DN1851_c0_g1_i1.p1 TRINITY_DN1851_c0_g1~~TRINITY_DN1851_c0_g1_i1.p1  ORF type:complete len:464 (-),score=69.61 TRINITY_DN1851_c0_g1_i1:35-1426(-)